MKKIMALAALLCFLFTGVLSVFQVKSLHAEAVQDQQIYAVEAPAAASVDYEALYRSHPAEEVIGTVNGDPVLWEEYFYFYCGYAAEVESVMNYYNQYGYALSWEDPYGEGMTWADVPAESAEQSILQVRGIELYAAENGISLPADAEEQMDQLIEATAESALGEGATVEAFEEYLAKGYLSMPVYRRMLSTNLLYEQLLPENIEEMEAEEAQAVQEILSENLQKTMEKLSFVPDEAFQVPAVQNFLKIS